MLYGSDISSVLQICTGLPLSIYASKSAKFLPLTLKALNLEVFADKNESAKCFIPGDMMVPPGSSVHGSPS